MNLKEKIEDIYLDIKRYIAVVINWVIVFPIALVVMTISRIKEIHWDISEFKSWNISWEDNFIDYFKQWKWCLYRMWKPVNSHLNKPMYEVGNCDSGWLMKELIFAELVNFYKKGFRMSLWGDEPECQNTNNEYVNTEYINERKPVALTIEYCYAYITKNKKKLHEQYKKHPMKSLIKVLGKKKAIEYAAKNKKDMKDEVWCEIWADDAIEIEDQRIVEKIIKIRKYLWW